MRRTGVKNEVDQKQVDDRSVVEHLKDAVVVREWMDDVSGSLEGPVVHVAQSLIILNDYDSPRHDDPGLIGESKRPPPAPRFEARLKTLPFITDDCYCNLFRSLSRSSSRTARAGKMY